MYEKKRLIRKALEGAHWSARSTPLAACGSRLLSAHRGVARAAADGKPIPTELYKEEAKLKEAVELEDVQTAALRSTIDDEYARAGASPGPAPPAALEGGCIAKKLRSRWFPGAWFSRR